MEEDEYGFLYPCINEKLCVACGSCNEVCGYQNRDETNLPINAYAAVTKLDSPMYRRSASGGVFAGLAQIFLAENGLVYGCSLELTNNQLKPSHIRIDSMEELPKLQGSKYVQSDIGRTYTEVKTFLEAGRLILFSGTPCQIAGLKSYLRKGYENLYTLDVICHGVPSIKLFQDYLAELEKKLRGKIIDFKFRDKLNGWGLNGKVIYLKNKCHRKEKTIPAKLSSYYSFFQLSDSYRESCYSCKYANVKRPGDITMGDYWGIQKEHPDLLVANGGTLDDTKGISCMIINTKQGKKCMEKYGSGLSLYQSSFEKIANNNAQLNHPSLKSIRRQQILEMYSQYGYAVVEKWFSESLGAALYWIKLKDLLPKKLRTALKKLFHRF